MVLEAPPISPTATSIVYSEARRNSAHPRIQYVGARERLRARLRAVRRNPEQCVEAHEFEACGANPVDDLWKGLERRLTISDGSASDPIVHLNHPAWLHAGDDPPRDSRGAGFDRVEAPHLPANRQQAHFAHDVAEGRVLEALGRTKEERLFSNRPFNRGVAFQKLATKASPTT